MFTHLLFVKRALLALVVLVLVGIAAVAILTKSLVSRYEASVKQAKVLCSSFSSIDEAKAYVKSHPEAKKELDRDGDGIPCESL